MMTLPFFPSKRRLRVADAEKEAELQRQQELNHYLRMKQIEEQERQRAQEAYLRRRQQREDEEDEYRKAYQEVMFRRRMAEEEEERRRRQQELRQRQQFRGNSSNGRGNSTWTPRYVESDDEDNVDDVNYPIRNTRPDGTYSIRNSRALPSQRTQPKVFRGKDGRLYQIRDDLPVRNPTTSHQKGNKQTINTDLMDVDDEGIIEKQQQPSTRHSRKVDGTSSQTTSKRQVNAHKKGKKKIKKRVTVIVEDASDSEYDHEFDTPARNRRPSPGQWMEPV